MSEPHASAVPAGTSLEAPDPWFPESEERVRRVPASLVALGAIAAAGALTWGWEAITDSAAREQTRKRLAPRPKPAPPSAADIKVA